MVKDSENVKVKEGGIGGTIRIGATGKVSALMMQELESNIKTSSRKSRIQTAPVSIGCGSTKRLQRMVSMSMTMTSNGGSSSSSARAEVTTKKKKKTKQPVQQVPMLDSEDLWMDKTPVRGVENKKVTRVTRRIVETVDLKCGKNDADWFVSPIGHQIRRLSFSKMLD